MTTLSDQVHDGPVTLPYLNFVHLGQAAHRCQLLVDGVGRQMPRFQVHAIARNYDGVEGETRLEAVPRNKLIDGVFVDAARGGEPRLLSTASLE